MILNVNRRPGRPSTSVQLPGRPAVHFFTGPGKFWTNSLEGPSVARW